MSEQKPSISTNYEVIIYERLITPDTHPSDPNRTVTLIRNQRLVVGRWYIINMSFIILHNNTVSMHLDL